MKKSGIFRLAAGAALVLCMLGGCGTEPAISSRAELVEHCNAGLDELRELGLFTAEFEVTPADEVPDFEYEGYGPRPELPEDRYEGVITLWHGYGTGGEYSCSMDVDTDTGKITGLHITARQQESWVPVSTFFRNVAGSDVLGIYDNPEALFDTEMTLGGMCTAWAEYQGYERYELPMDAADGVTFLGAQELEAWNDGYREPRGITVSFFREGEKEPEYYSFNYTPTGMGPVFMIAPAEGPYVPEDWAPVPREEIPAPPGERDAAELINAELDKLRELGLLRAELEVTREECLSADITAGRIGEEFTGRVYLTSSQETGEYNYHLCYNAGTGRLEWLQLCERPSGGVNRVDDVYGCFEGVIDPDLTLGRYCQLWAEYQGYERYELPEGAGADVPCLDARSLAAWDDGAEGELGEGLTVSFFREGGSEAEYACVNYGPSLMGPCVIIGRGGEVPIWRPSQALG